MQLRWPKDPAIRATIVVLIFFMGLTAAISMRAPPQDFEGHATNFLVDSMHEIAGAWVYGVFITKFSFLWWAAAGLSVVFLGCALVEHQDARSVMKFCVVSIGVLSAFTLWAEPWIALGDPVNNPTSVLWFAAQAFWSFSTFWIDIIVTGLWAFAVMYVCDRC
jgi:hypothetical protein